MTYLLQRNIHYDVTLVTTNQLPVYCNVVQYRSTELTEFRIEQLSDAELDSPLEVFSLPASREGSGPLPLAASRSWHAPPLAAPPPARRCLSLSLSSYLSLSLAIPLSLSTIYIYIYTHTHTHTRGGWGGDREGLLAHEREEGQGAEGPCACLYIYIYIYVSLSLYIYIMIS